MREMTLTEAAKVLPGSIHCKTIFRWIRDGVMGYRRKNGTIVRERVHLQARKRGGRWFVTVEALDEFSHLSTPPQNRPTRPQRKTLARRAEQRHQRAKQAAYAMGLTPPEGHVME